MQVDWWLQYALCCYQTAKAHCEGSHTVHLFEFWKGWMREYLWDNLVKNSKFLDPGFEQSTSNILSYSTQNALLWVSCLYKASLVRAEKTAITLQVFKIVVRGLNKLLLLLLGNCCNWLILLLTCALLSAYPSLHSFGVVHWVPVLSNIKTATGCESNRQLQLWTVFAGTVVYIINSTVFKDGLGSYVK